MSLLDLSLIEQVAMLDDGVTKDELLEIVATMDPQDPELILRPSQLAVLHDKSWIVLMVAGRGAGKSKTGAEWVTQKAKEPNTRIALVGRTVADVRDTMVEGDSGILSSSPEDFKPVYTPSLRKLEWPNGTVAHTYSADQPSMLRGPQSHYTWSDELAAHPHKPDDSGATMWDNVILSTRLGEHPQILVTTTPKRTAIMRDLFRDAYDPKKLVSLHKASTIANRANLSKEYIDAVYDKYGGTHLEMQELHGELIGDSPGALWRSSDIVIGSPKTLDDLFIVVGVDPAVEPGRDDTGIVVVAATREPDLRNRRAWVVDDLTINGSPDEWAQIVVDAQKKYSRPNNEALVVVEGNQGGQLLDMVLHQIAPNLPVAIVKAVRSKSARAEPVVFAYRRHRVEHCDDFPGLVEELTGWEPDMTRWSPGHLDACFVAGTSVTTSCGDVPIEDIWPDDLVWTRQGWKPVEAVRCTESDAETWVVDLSNGRSLIGTPEHRILCNGEFVALDALVWGDSLDGWQSSNLLPQFSTAGLSTNVGQTLLSSVRTTNTETNLEPVAVHVVASYAGSKGAVYDLQVADAHEFLAEGVIVHNCVWGLHVLLVDDTPLRKFAPVSVLSRSTESLGSAIPAHRAGRPGTGLALAPWRSSRR